MDEARKKLIKELKEGTIELHHLPGCGWCTKQMELLKITTNQFDKLK